MTDTQQLLQKILKDIKDAVGHLEYSYLKVQKLPKDKDKLSEEQLESYEGFVSRFARMSDLFCAQYLRLKILIADPAFRGELMDILNKAEKMGLIDNAKHWYEVRTLRNFSLYEYAGAKFTQTVARMIELTPLLLAAKNAS